MPIPDGPTDPIEHDLAAAFEGAWDEWAAAGDRVLWDRTIADGTDGETSAD